MDDASRGRFPSANLTPAQLRRRKVDAIKLALCFSYAVKHYLRGEDGLDWDDYAGILPAQAARLYRGLYQPPNKDYKYSTPGSSTNGKSTGYASYAATEFATRLASPEAFDTGASTPGAETLHDVERGTHAGSTDATKRVRVKRSKDRMKAPGQTSTTPLMSSLQHTIDFSPAPDSLCAPLPMVIAHELSHALFKFRRDGYLETVGPAGVNAMNTLYVLLRLFLQYSTLADASYVAYKAW